MALRFASGVSNALELDRALDSIFAQIEPAMEGVHPDLAILFTTDAYIDSCFEISRKIRERLSPRVLVGCTGGGIIGSDQEYEDQAAISLLVGALEGVNVRPIYLTQEDLEGLETDEDVITRFEVTPAENPSFFLLPDPFSINGYRLLSLLDRSYPASVKLGGMASAGFQPGSNRLYLNGNVYLSGAVGVSLTGAVEIAPLVSQGCRPIGAPLLVTAAEENAILQLGALPALEALQELVTSLPEADRRLAQRALLVGVVIDEYKNDFQRGDFLIRNLLGADPNSGMIVINDRVSVGQTIQFQVRDAASAAEDLECLLEASRGSWGNRDPVAAAVFNCNGRGLRLFPDRNHDISTIHGSMGPIPSAGFFCAGEIGPVGGKSFVHGFTSSIGFFLPKF
ncbi:MAG: hypothetical protein GHCLOJNM_02271 [bacterium]|nr:hypothetical protein [bacterium]